MAGNYNYNSCVNPSFEIDLTGYTALAGTSLTQVSYNASRGQHSMQVVTDGSVSGEGFYGPVHNYPYGTPTPAFVQNVCTGPTVTSGNTSTLTVSAVSTTPGNVIVLAQRVLGGGTVLSVSDSRGNTWQVDNAGQNTLSNVAMCSAVMGSATYLRAGDTIVVTATSTSIDSGSTYPQAGAAEFSGLNVTGGHANVRTYAVAHAAASPVTVATLTPGVMGDMAVTAMCAGVTGAGHITLTVNDPDTGTWTDMTCPYDGTVDMAWQEIGGSLDCSATWSNTIGSNTTGIITVYEGAPLSKLSTVQIDLSGETGNVNVQAVVNPGGIVLASQAVALTFAWQTVTFNNVPIPSEASLYVLVTTASAQAITFLADAVQYADIAVAPGYIDGSSPGCFWTGTPNESASYQPAQFQVSAAGGMYLDGQGQLGTTGQILQLSGAGGVMTVTAVNPELTYVPPVGALDDFAIWPSTDVDPAMSYVAWNNANTYSGETNYSNVWGIFYPPLDYPTSDTLTSGVNLWNRAAYMAVGFEYAEVPAGAAQNTTQVQVSLMPLAGTDTYDGTIATTPPAPYAYDAPRSIHVIVKPTRLNYVKNPSFEVSTSGWTAGTNTTLTQDTTNAYGIIGEWDGIQFSSGSASGKCIVAAGQGGSLSTNITHLLPGEIYIASAYVQIQNAAISDIQMTAGGNFSDSIATGANLDSGWYRQSVVFTAPASTVMLTVAVLPGTTTEFLALSPYSFWVDACLCEPGEILNEYFDGNFADSDYGWESGGTPGLSRSYYYEDYEIKQGTVLDILQSHIPVGLSYATPLYFTVPSQLCMLCFNMEFRFTL